MAPPAKRKKPTTTLPTTTLPSTGSGDDQSEKTKEIDSDPAASNAHLVVQAEEDIAGIENFLSTDVVVQSMSPL